MMKQLLLLQKGGEWTDLSVTSYTIPENAYNTTIRIETKESNTDFYIDNAYVAEAGVRSYMNKLIEESTAESQKRRYKLRRYR